MTTINFKGNPVTTCGELPGVGDQLPEFDLVGTDLSAVRSADFAGKRIVLNIFPSVDTGVCAKSVRTFNELASKLDNTAVVCVSKDLPFAQDRFCGAEGIDNVTSASAFRSDFGEVFGITMTDGPLAGLLARCVVIADPSGKIIYTDINDEVTTEPNYDAAVAALS